MMQKIGLLIAVLIACSCQNFAFAQDKNVQFYNLNEEYNIAIREANQALSDDYGFTWISSKMGIVRYTMDDIRIYHLPYSSEDIIMVHLAYKSGVLYAYTNNGQFFEYNSIQDKFYLILDMAKEMNNPYIFIKRMLLDGEGKLWMATSFGLFSYEKGEGIVELRENKNIEYIEWYNATSFFYVISEHIGLFNIDTGTFENYFGLPEEVIHSVSNLYYDQHTDGLWIGTMTQGLFYLKNQKGRYNLILIDGIPNQPILALEECSDSIMMVGIDGQGLWEVSINNGKILNAFKKDEDDPHSLQGNGVYDIFCDGNDRVWVCTYTGGVSYFDQANPLITNINHKINNSNSLVNDGVNSVLEDSNGNLWFGTNNGISYWNTSTNEWKSFYHNKEKNAPVFHDLCEDDSGRIWAGTYSSGVYVLDIKSGRQIHHYSPDETNGEFSLNYVFDIYKDSKGNIWIGGVNGDLICYKVKEKKFKVYENFTVKVIKEYQPGQMLIGTTLGLVSLDTETGNTERLLERYLVYDFFIDGDNVWVCTSGSGIISYNLKTKEQKRLTIDSGLPSNFVNSIISSGGYFWIGTESGLCRLDKDGNSILSFKTFPELSGVSFNQNSHYIQKTGKLIFGTDKGAIIFDPDIIPASEQEGKIFFQDMMISGRSIRQLPKFELTAPLDSLGEVSLRYYQNTISLELIPIGVKSPGSKFSWKMEGIDDNWTKPTNNRILSYSNIPSGTYFLRVRMFDSSLDHIIEERAITLHIIPPYWERWWFRVFVLVFFIGFGVFLLFYYVDRLKKRHSEEKIRFFANTAHELRTSLTLIKGPIDEVSKDQSLTDSSRTYLQLAREQAKRLLNVVTQLMDFQKVDVGKEKLSLTMADIVGVVRGRVVMFESYAHRRNIKIEFTANCPEFVTAIDEAMIEKIVDNLLSNAIKYSKSGQLILVSIECTPSKWIFEVKDEGIGIDKRAQKQLFKEYYRGENAVNSRVVGSGIGLLLVKNYVDLLDGKITCNSQLGIGSTFQVVVPCKEVSEFASSEDLLMNSTLLLSEETQEGLMKKESTEQGSMPKMKILVVEDNDSLRGFLKSAMANRFRVSIAEDGEQALEKIRKEAPDLVVSDIMMPKMDGFELCRRMKSTYETSHIPLILLTALAGKAQQLKGLRLGADGYLTKPFDVSLLEERINSIIKNREIVRDRALKIIKHSENEVVLENELNDAFMKQMLVVARENISNAEFSRNDFAAAMNVSPSLLYKKMKSLTGQSPSDFVRSVRLDHSLELLKTKKYTITEVSEMCGFSSIGYFGMVFRKHYGKSPSQVFD
nr:two-component regulator propeller domain-containing protein [uncultured Draconibacterium sp.]